MDGLELNKKSKTFDSNYAVAILALSFPLSTVLILGVLNSGALLDSSINIFLSGCILISLGCVFPLFNLLSKKAMNIRMGHPELDSTSPERI
ncbi:MAG: hypothetical protein AAF039_10930 [Bacteroidota bacterium]